MERSDDESLVDAKLLSYAYLEAGVIEMLGGLVMLIYIHRNKRKFLSKYLG